MPKRPIPIPFQLEIFGLETIIPNPQQVSKRPGPRHEPQGQVYDLAHFFDTINNVMFKGQLRAPILRWSRNRWKYTLGLCDVEKGVITLNCSLDDARVPEMVVAGIMHHEMLHIYFGFSESSNGSRRFHTPEFRTAEKLFPGYEATERWLKDHWPLIGRPAKKKRQTDSSFLAFLALMHG